MELFTYPWMYGPKFKAMEGRGKKATLLLFTSGMSYRLTALKDLVARMNPEVSVYRQLCVPDRQSLVEVVAPHIDDRYPSLIFIAGLCEIEVNGNFCGKLAKRVRNGRFLCDEHRRFLS